MLTLFKFLKGLFGGAIVLAVNAVGRQRQADDGGPGDSMTERKGVIVRRAHQDRAVAARGEQVHYGTSEHIGRPRSPDPGHLPGFRHDPGHLAEPCTSAVIDRREARRGIGVAKIGGPLVPFDGKIPRMGSKHVAGFVDFDHMIGGDGDILDHRRVHLKMRRCKIRKKEIVGIDEYDETSLDLLEGDQRTAQLALVLAEADQTEPPIALDVSGNDILAPVGRSIIDHDTFEMRIILRDDGIDRLPDISGVIPVDENETDEWRIDALNGFAADRQGNASRNARAVAFRGGGKITGAVLFHDRCKLEWQISRSVIAETGRRTRRGGAGRVTPPC